MQRLCVQSHDYQYTCMSHHVVQQRVNRMSKERIVSFFPAHRRQGAVAGAQQRGLRQREDLLADFLPRQFPRLVPTSDGTRKNRVPHDRHVRRVVGPGANNICDAVLRVAGRVPVGDAQAAQVDEIAGAVPVLRRGALGSGVEVL